MAANGSSAGSIKVGIVGAGVAGLAAGIALRRIGHDVEVNLSDAGSDSEQIGDHDASACLCLIG